MNISKKYIFTALNYKYFKRLFSQIFVQSIHRIKLVGYKIITKPQTAQTNYDIRVHVI